jgi:polysaccharide deacetylase family protein (PEP-CTERM system associated)
MRNALTVDLEDWFQGINLPFETWNQYECRIHIGVEKILTLLQTHNTKATFFTLGKVIDDHPSLILKLIQEGHEIGCHTYSHPALYNITPELFEQEISKCNEAFAKVSTLPFKGFRAPYFSVDARSLWALDILKQHGFIYDSSIYPGDNLRTGIPGYQKQPHILDNGLIEIPMTTIKVTKFDCGLGGAYFRILPYTYFRKKLQELNDNGINGNFYIHPWELDPLHPKLNSLPNRIKWPHYFNLKSTYSKLDSLLNDFEFGTVESVFLKDGILSN